MRAALAIALVLALGAQNKRHSMSRGGGSPVVLSIPADTVGTTLTATTGQTVTCTRASSATYQTSATAIATASSNQCRVEADGLLVEPARTNIALRGDDLTASPWYVYAAGAAAVPTVSTSGVLCPDGVTYATQIDFPATLVTDTSVVAQDTVGGSPTNPNTTSLWARMVTGTGTLPIGSTTTGTHTGDCALTTTWTRCAYTSTSPRYIQIGYFQRVSSAFSVYACHAQSENGAFATSYTPTTGTSASRPADAISVSNPLTNGATDWCVTLTAKPESTRAWAAHESNWWTFGTVSPNYATLDSYTDGVLYFDTYDSGGGFRRASVTHGFSAGTSHKITSCNTSGQLSLAFDGVAQSVSQTGAGTATIGTMPTVWLGSSGGLAGYAAGNISGFKICNSSDFSRCQ